jgi:putative transposase
MAPAARCQPGGVVCHGLNRGDARGQVFDKSADYIAFERVMLEAAAQVDMRLLAYYLMPNH